MTLLKKCVLIIPRVRPKQRKKSQYQILVILLINQLLGSCTINCNV